MRNNFVSPFGDIGSHDNDEMSMFMMLDIIGVLYRSII